MKHLTLQLSGTAFTTWTGAETQTLHINASDHTGLNLVVRHADASTPTHRFAVNATDRSLIKVRGLRVSPEQVKANLADEAALVFNEEYTAVASDRLAHH